MAYERSTASYARQPHRDVRVTHERQALVMLAPEEVRWCNTHGLGKAY